MRPPRLLLAAFALVALAACGDDDDPAATAPAPTATAAESTGAAPTSAVAPTPTVTARDEPGATAAVPPPPATGDPAGAEVALAPVGSFEQPTDLTWWEERSAMLVAEKTGRLWAVGADDGEPELVVDLSGLVSTESERGLLGSAVSPDGARLYASWTDVDGTSRVTSWELGDLPLDPGERVDVLSVAQPFANHNGGNLAVGPDGLLYLGLGDGGSAGDPEGNGQDPDTLLGTILRIDPRPEGGYDVPVDNPFADGGGAPEVYLWGLRNPWKFAFDPATGDLWIGDVGQNDLEEIDVVPAGVSGLNLGWDCFEGDRVFAGCEVDDHLGPIHTYGRDDGTSVTGGLVYRGTAVPALAGSYLFGDFGSGTVWALGPGDRERVELGVDVEGLTSFGEDGDGEVWVAGIGGEVQRLVPAG